MTHYRPAPDRSMIMTTQTAFSREGSPAVRTVLEWGNRSKAAGMLCLALALAALVLASEPATSGTALGVAIAAALLGSLFSRRGNAKLAVLVAVAAVGVAVWQVDHPSSPQTVTVVTVPTQLPTLQP